MQATIAGVLTETRREQVVFWAKNRGACFARGRENAKSSGKIGKM